MTNGEKWMIAGFVAFLMWAATLREPGSIDQWGMMFAAVAVAAKFWPKDAHP